MLMVNYAGRNNCLNFVVENLFDLYFDFLKTGYDFKNGSFIEFREDYNDEIIIYLSLMSKYKISKSGIMLNDKILIESDSNVCIYDVKESRFKRGDKLRFFADGISEIKDCEIRIGKDY